MKEGKRIPVQAEGLPVVGCVPVEHDTSHGKSPDATIVQREAMTVTPSTRSELDGAPSLEDWAEYFTPSIERLLSSSERSFLPQAVSIEREIFYRDQEPDWQDESSRPRRVRVTRRRVTLFGMVQHRQP